jgi:hypothetical protein
MTSGSKIWLRGGLLAALALGLGALGAGTLVRAQDQTGGPATSTDQPRAVDEPPPPVVHPAAKANEADDEADSSQSSAKPAAPTPPKPVIPLKRPRYGVAIIQALDKVTAETERFEAPLNTPVRYKTLIFTVRACETTASDEDIVDAAAHVEVVSQPKAPEGGTAPPPRQIFKGWMFANSPGLNLLQHPIYDAWLIACKTPAPSA